MSHSSRSIRRIAAALLFAAIVAWSAHVAAFPRTLIDGVGREVHLPTRPERIFSAALAMDNILLSIVEPDRVVGVTMYAKDPSVSYVADKVRPHMAIVEALNPEQAIAARPDVVLVASWSSPDAVRQLQELGVPVYVFSAFSSVSDALENIERMGVITGNEKEAKALIDAFYEEYDRIAARIDERQRPRVLSLNSWGSTTGLGTSMHDIIEMAGGVNAAAEFGITGWQDVGPETVILINPDVIVTDSGEAYARKILTDPALQSVKAVREGRVYAIEHAEALNHHFILAIRQLAELLHPGAF